MREGVGCSARGTIASEETARALHAASVGAPWTGGCANRRKGQHCASSASSRVRVREWSPRTDKRGDGVFKRNICVWDRDDRLKVGTRLCNDLHSHGASVNARVAIVLMITVVETVNKPPRPTVHQDSAHTPTHTPPVTVNCRIHNCKRIQIQLRKELTSSASWLISSTVVGHLNGGSELARRACEHQQATSKKKYIHIYNVVTQKPRPNKEDFSLANPSKTANLLQRIQ